MCQTRVVEGAHLSGTQVGRAAAEVGDERLGEATLALAGGEPEDRAGEPVEVQRGPGERHRRVHRDHAGADPAGRLGTARPWRPEVCTTSWPARMAPLSLRTVTTLPSMSSGTVRNRSLARATSVAWRAPLRAGARRSASATRRTRRRRRPRGGRRSRGRRRDSADATAPITPTRSPVARAGCVMDIEPFRSSPSDHPLRIVAPGPVGTGRCARLCVPVHRVHPGDAERTPRSGPVTSSAT